MVKHTKQMTPVMKVIAPNAPVLKGVVAEIGNVLAVVTV